MNPVLPEETLARRDQLPLKPEGIVMEGKKIRLMPLDVETDAEPLFSVTDGSPITLGGRHVDEYDADELVWRYMFGGPFATLIDFMAYLDRLVKAPNGRAYSVIDKASGWPVGIACYLNNSPQDLKIELGSITYSPIVQRTGANTEATYLMLKRAFDLGYRRLEWKCDALNERSRHSALRMGFQFEGIQEAHMIIKRRNRDTAWFRILAHEWPGVKQHLETLLER